LGGTTQVAGFKVITEGSKSGSIPIDLQSPRRAPRHLSQKVIDQMTEIALKAPSAQRAAKKFSATVAKDASL
jgi:hypothetical protein